jgi:hypothetical protein
MADEVEIPTEAKLFRAISPSPDPGSAFGLTVAMPLLWTYRRLGRRSQSRQSLARSGLPLARRMVLGVTDDRLIVWSASKSWEPQSLLGEFARGHVRDATAPTVGQGWRTVRIELDEGEPVVIKVVADKADELAALLSSG